MSEPPVPLIALENAMARIAEQADEIERLRAALEQIESEYQCRHCHADHVARAALSESEGEALDE